MPVVASLLGVMHTVCRCNVIKRKSKERNCLYAAMWMYISEGDTNTKNKKIYCSIVMTQWSNLYLFSALNEFNSQKRSVPVHWLDRCVLSDWIWFMSAAHFLSLCIDFGNCSFFPVGSTSNLSLSPHAGAYLDFFFYYYYYFLVSLKCKTWYVCSVNK